ncbi:phosphatase PAP2 family protein [Streptomyces melanogenes]|uniref:phosphatase PAP2 family protein n=1 Tax=Streptomyces melanogenes TaxID=67326 RepID=UPI00167CB8B7|nr:phosphatase PAP2 family protein [Streptomyces melanogenes]GGP89698.1 hypothetical protein GCM10010278_80120 [Streptomyces melanogenes]
MRSSQPAADSRPWAGAPPRHPVPAAPPRGALAAGIVLLAAALAIGLAARGGGHPFFQGLDDRWMRWLGGGPDGAAVGFARLLDKLGGPLGLVLPLGAVGCLGIYGRWRSAVFMFTSSVVANTVVVLPMKQLVDRPRPSRPQVLVNDGSFPSGQVFLATALVLTAGIVLFAPPVRRWWWPFAAVIVAVVMWSRMRLGAQWLSDTVAGAAAGAGVVLVLWTVFARLLEDEAERAAAGHLWG